MNIGNIKINNNLFLAPMAGVTDRPFRTLCKMFGVGLTYTEMVSVKGLYYKSKKTEELLAISNLEHPCAVQLFGHEPEIFKSVIESGVLDKFDIIDINMGCPAPKIVKNGDGSALMKNLSLASEIIKACVSVTNKPITVKFRKGFKKGDDKLIEFAKMCEKSGASAITIHPRTREDMFTGKINIDDIKKVKNSVNIAVIGNGDVTSVDEYNKMNAICDGVMIGREAFKNPAIFFEILKQNNHNPDEVSFFTIYNKIFFENKNINTIVGFENGLSIQDNIINNNLDSKIKKFNSALLKHNELQLNFTEEEETYLYKLQIINMHLVLLKQQYSKECIVKIFKKYILSYLSGLKNATSLKKEIVLINNLDIMQTKIYDFFDPLVFKK